MKRYTLFAAALAALSGCAVLPPVPIAVADLRPTQGSTVSGTATFVERSDKYSPDVSYMQRIRAIALDAAAGLPVVAKDLAAARTTSASSQQAGSESSTVVDGNKTTGWQPTTTAGTQWVQVDLGRQAQLDGIRLHWGNVYATKYRVLQSS